MRIDKLLLVPVMAMSLALVGCQAEQTEEGEMPDVNVEGGNLPEYDADAADVEVGTDTQTVEVPDVDVTAPDEGGTDM